MGHPRDVVLNSSRLVLIIIHSVISQWFEIRCDILTWYYVDDIDWGYPTEDGQDIANVWEDNRDWTASNLETYGANNVELSREVFFSCRHEIKRVSKWDVIHHNVSDHSWDYQNTGDSLQPIGGPVFSRWFATKDNLRCVVKSGEVASERHHCVERKDEQEWPSNDLHKTILNWIDELLVYRKYIALVCVSK